MRRPLGSFTRKTGRKTHSPIDACRKERPGESDERGVNARRAASCLPACGGTCSRPAVTKAILPVHFCHSDRAGGMERVGRATWTEMQRRYRRQSRETNKFNRLLPLQYEEMSRPCATCQQAVSQLHVPLF